MPTNFDGPVVARSAADLFDDLAIVTIGAAADLAAWEDAVPAGRLFFNTTASTLHVADGQGSSDAVVDGA